MRKDLKKRKESLSSLMVGKWAEIRFSSGFEYSNEEGDTDETMDLIGKVKLLDGNILVLSDISSPGNLEPKIRLCINLFAANIKSIQLTDKNPDHFDEK